jgi:hypothetical protein
MDETKDDETTLSGCPACGASRRYSKAPDTTIVPERLHAFVRECRKCQGIYTTSSIYLGDSYLIVLPFFSSDPESDSRQRYFDLDCLGSKGMQRRHGWFDPTNKKLTQVG